MIRILLACDQGIVRAGLKQLLMPAGDMAVIAESANDAEIAETLRKKPADLLLLSLAACGYGNTALLSRIRACHAQLPILVVSLCDDIRVAHSSLRAGVNGYLANGSTSDMLLTAIREIAKGKRFIDPVVAEKIVLEQERLGESSLHERLSRREIEVLRMLASGKRISDIAGELVVSPKTVSTHKTRVMQKMQFFNNVDLIRYGMEYGMMS